jgi:zinc/manganese transport system permease protein
MERLFDSLPFLVAPLVACLVIAGLHCYMGLHVIKRGVIFVDLALAQCAALGAAVALLIGPLIHVGGEHHAAQAGQSSPELVLAGQTEATAGPLNENSTTAAGNEPKAFAPHEEHDRWLAQAMSVVFALLGAVLLSLGRFRGERVPHEAVIGIVFVVGAAISVLILSKAPHGHERMEAMLVGNILFVRWPQVAIMAVLYLVLGAFHFALRKPLLEISRDLAAADRAGRRVRLWDCFFYGSFALMVTQSVGIAGLLVVFSYLIIPAACAALLAERFSAQLGVAWVVSVVTTVAGLLVSALADLPTGPSLVGCFGTVLVICVALRSLLRGQAARTG